MASAPARRGFSGWSPEKSTPQKYNAEAASNGVQPVNFGIVKYPHPDGAPAGSTLGTVTSLAVNANSEKKEAALDFVNWCASEDGAKCVAAVGTFPAVASDETNKIISSTDGFPSDDASLEALVPTSLHYTPIPEFAPVQRDLALVAPESMECGTLITEMQRACKQLTKVELFDIYRGEKPLKGNLVFPCPGAFPDNSVQKLTVLLTELSRQRIP